VGLRRSLTRIGRALGGEPHPDGESELHVGDARFDDWDIVRDFEDLETARAWRQLLRDRGVESALTADWPLDRFGRGDVALRVPAGHGLEAEELLEDEQGD
jgi:hypothetical protein